MFSDAFPPCLDPLPLHPTPYPAPGGPKYSLKARFEAKFQFWDDFPNKMDLSRSSEGVRRQVAPPETCKICSGIDLAMFRSAQTTPRGDSGVLSLLESLRVPALNVSRGFSRPGKDKVDNQPSITLKIERIIALLSQLSSICVWLRFSYRISFEWSAIQSLYHFHPDHFSYRTTN